MTAPERGRKMKPRFAPRLLTLEPDDEALPEVAKGERVPGTPFGFLWFLVRRHYRWRLAAFVACVAFATAIEAMSPDVLRRTINALTEATQAGVKDFSAVALYLVLLGIVWYAPGVIERAAEAIDIYMSPRMRALAQKYLFAYMLGHSPRYFQENFAGKLGQKVKQAGQATVSLLSIVAFDSTRIVVLLGVGGVLLALQSGYYAAVLFGWTAVYLIVVTWLARRCVTLSKAFSDEVSTSTGRLIDAISNADLVRAFARAAQETGRLDAVVVNAGIQLHKRDLPVHEQTLDSWDATQDVNYRGAFISCRAAARQMLAQGGGGSIVIMSSVTAFVGAASQNPAYTASRRYNIAACVALGDMEAARAGAAQLLRLEPDFRISIYADTRQAFRDEAQRQAFLDHLCASGLPM